MNKEVVAKANASVGKYVTVLYGKNSSVGGTLESFTKNDEGRWFANLDWNFSIAFSEIRDIVPYVDDDTSVDDRQAVREEMDDYIAEDVET